MSKLKLFLILASALLISCGNPNDPDNGNDTGPGGGGTGTGGGGGTGNPSWFLTAEQQKTPWSIDKTLAITVSGKAHYRITGILATKHAKNNNKIIAIYDNRKTSNADIGFANAANLEPLIRISEDGGNTWGAEITVGPVATSKDTSHGDPVIFEANNGDIVVLAAAGGAWATAPGNPSRISVIKSTDGGKNWGQWKDVQGTMFKSGKLYDAGFRKGFASSGRGTILKDNTLVCAVLCGDANASAASRGVALFYSKDNGDTWNVGGFKVYGHSTEASRGFDEPKVSAELVDGKILLSARPNNYGNNRLWLVADNVDTNPVEFATVDLVDGNANAEGVRYTATWNGQTKNRLLFINCNSKNSRRKELTIHLSEDEGKTYSTKRLLNAENSCYSSVDVLGDGTIITFGEETPTASTGLDIYNLVFRRFNLAWLTQGKEIYSENY